MRKFAASWFIFLVATAAYCNPFFDIQNPMAATYREETEPGFEEHIQLQGYSAAQPPKVVFRSAFGKLKDGTCHIDNQECDLEKGNVLNLGKMKGPHHAIVALSFRNEGGEFVSKKYKIGLRMFPIHQVEGKSKLSENILYAIRQFLFEIDPEGNVVFFRNEKHMIMDFKKHRIDGKTFYSYLRIMRTVKDLHQEGQQVVMDDKYSVIHEFNWDADAHEFHMLGKDHFVHFEYRVKDHKKLGCIINQTIVETIRGKSKVVFATSDWVDKKEHQSAISEKRAFKGRFCHDFLHLNSLQIINANQWLVSVGEAVIMYDPPKKKILWSLGNTFDQFKTKQNDALKDLMIRVHTPLFEPGTSTLTLYSNKFNPDQSAIVELKLDIKSKRIVDYFIYKTPKFYSSHSGGFVKSGDILTYSTSFDENSEFDIAEIDRSGVQPHFKIVLIKDKRPYIYRVNR